MIFESTQIPDVVLITPQRFTDDRGYFTQTWGEDEFEAHGLNPRVVARNVSYNVAARTLRGMHFQHPPHAETKLVTCTHGAIYDVAIDLRPNRRPSPAGSAPSCARKRAPCCTSPKALRTAT